MGYLGDGRLGEKSGRFGRLGEKSGKFGRFKSKMGAGAGSCVNMREHVFGSREIGRK